MSLVCYDSAEHFSGCSLEHQGLVVVATRMINWLAVWVCAKLDSKTKVVLHVALEVLEC